eukprot:2853101-Rhodomonas_salina.2
MSSKSQRRPEGGWGTVQAKTGANNVLIATAASADGVVTSSWMMFGSLTWSRELDTQASFCYEELQVGTGNHQSVIVNDWQPPHQAPPCSSALLSRARLTMTGMLSQVVLCLTVDGEVMDSMCTSMSLSGSQLALAPSPDHTYGQCQPAGDAECRGFGWSSA